MRVLSSSLLAVGMVLSVPSVYGQAVDPTDDLCDVMPKKTVAAKFGMEVWNCNVTGNVNTIKTGSAFAGYVFAGYQKVLTIRVTHTEPPLSLEDMQRSLKEGYPTGEFVSGVGLVAYVVEGGGLGKASLRGYFSGKATIPGTLFIEVEGNYFFDQQAPEKLAPGTKQNIIDIAREVIAKLTK